jgi:hypothetical protein
MTAEESILAQITHLLEEGAMPRSACSGSLLKTLQPLLYAGVVVEERSGGGRRLVVRDAAALQEFSRLHFPDIPVSDGLSSRATGVARFRDSKAFASDTPEIVSVRAWSEKALSQKGQPSGAAVATARHGVFSFLLAGAEHYTLRGPCALVENPDVFTQFEYFQLPVGLVIYGHGRTSNRLVDWLSTMTSPDFQLLHLPDYDPVGLTEFERLRSRLGKRVRLHLPHNLDQQFARFSSRTLLKHANSQSMLASLRRTASPEVRNVVALIDRHNAGLEQEALLLKEHVATPQ